MIPVNEPLLNGNEKKYLNECIDTGWISSEGPFVEKLETAVANRVGRKHGIAVCNGSVAIDVAVVALGLGVGDEVIMPTFTIISCAAAVVRAGATPVLVDCDPITWNIDVAQIEERITQKTRAIMVVHIYGLPTDMDPILELAQRYGLNIIEDAAEMLGQEYKDKPCGSFGNISTFSFYPNKHLTTGEGGMVLTDDDAIAERCRGLRNLCFNPKQRFIHDELGWNFRMTNLQAAVGCAQIERLDEFVQRKRKMGYHYTTLFTDIVGLQVPLARADYAENIYWVYGVVLGDSVTFAAKDAMEILAQKGVGSRPFFWPMHEQPVFRKMGFFLGEHHPVSERIARRGFYVPSGMALSSDQIEAVGRTVKELME